MNADARRWILAAALMTTIVVTTMASHANGTEPLFQLTPQIERLGGETLASDGDAGTTVQPRQESPLKYDGLRLTGDVDVDSPQGRFILAPAQGPAPILLDFAFPPAWNEGNKGPGGQFDHPTRPTPPPHDDSYLLAERDFTFGGMKFSR
jgi:hypothetical protein